MIIILLLIDIGIGSTSSNYVNRPTEIIAYLRRHPAAAATAEPPSLPFMMPLSRINNCMNIFMPTFRV